METTNFRNRSGFWMEAVVVFSTANAKGIYKDVKEGYIIEASSFMDAEDRIRKEFVYANKPIKTVSAMVRPKYGEICFSYDLAASNFYKVKVSISSETSIRTRKGGTRTKKKVTQRYHMVQASSIEAARKAVIDVVYKGSTEDYEIADIVKTQILDVLETGKHLSIGKEEAGQNG